MMLIHEKYLVGESSSYRNSNTIQSFFIHPFLVAIRPQASGIGISIRLVVSSWKMDEDDLMSTHSRQQLLRGTSPSSTAPSPSVSKGSKKSRGILKSKKQFGKIISQQIRTGTFTAFVRVRVRMCVFSLSSELSCEQWYWRYCDETGRLRSLQTDNFGGLWVKQVRDMVNGHMHTHAYIHARTHSCGLKGQIEFHNRDLMYSGNQTHPSMPPRKHNRIRRRLWNVVARPKMIQGRFVLPKRREKKRWKISFADHQTHTFTHTPCSTTQASCS